MVLHLLKTTSHATLPNLVMLAKIQRRSRRKVLAKATGRSSSTRHISPSTHADSYDRGREGEECQDYGYNFTNQRRRSNSSNQVLGDFKTKFEAVDQDPVFEEELHGPIQDDLDEGSTLSKESTDTSTLGGSVEEEEILKKN